MCAKHVKFKVVIRLTPIIKRTLKARIRSKNFKVDDPNNELALIS